MDTSSALEGARRGLALAQEMLALHRTRTASYCLCWHPLPCSVAEKAGLAAAQWRARVDYYESLQAAIAPPTVLLPLVGAGASERVWAGDLRGRYYE